MLEKYISQDYRDLALLSDEMNYVDRYDDAPQEYLVDLGKLD